MDNPWISYIDRSYRQIKNAILSKISNPSTGIPEMVDLSEGNDFVKMIGIWSGISEMVGYYLDNRARETFITKLQLFKSAVGLARQHDYRTRGAFPSEGFVEFTLNAIQATDITIPNGTIIKTNQDLQFVTTITKAITAGQLTVRVPIKQMISKILPTATSDGQPNQVIILEENVCDNAIDVLVDDTHFVSTETFTFATEIATPAVGYFDVDNGTESLPDDNISSIMVNGVGLLSALIPFNTNGETTARDIVTAINNTTTVPNYTAIQSGKRVLIMAVTKGTASNGFVLVVTATSNIIISNKTNLFAGEGETNFKVFRPFVNEDGLMTIEFGSGTNGEIPTGGKDIDITYNITEGASGNIAANLITTIVSVLNLPSGAILTITNPENTQGGIDQENLLSLKKNLPLFIRTKDRAVSWQDYKDIASLAPGVYNSDIYFACGKTVDVYVLPYGGGISNVAFRQRVWDYFEDNRLMITTKINVKPVGEVRLKLIFDVYVRAGYNTDTVLQLVHDNLLNFLSWRNSVIKSSLYIGDLYEVVETTPGVKSGYLTMLTILPFATYQNEGDKILNWTRELIAPGNTVKIFRIGFLNATQFFLTRNGVNVGTFSVGQLITLTEIEFTVLAGDYSANDTWTFRTYPMGDQNSGKIELDEFSIITSYDADLTLTLVP